jgi:hypothetical protein
MQNPWALLLVLGIKKIETRSWMPGRSKIENLLIHSSANTNKAAKEFWNSPWYHENVRPLIGQMEETMGGIQYHFGAIIGAVDVKGCYPTKSFPNDILDVQGNLFAPMAGGGELMTPIGKLEFMLGDYISSNRRIGWVCENPRLLTKPIPAKGALNLWTYETDEPLTFTKVA